MPLLSVGTDGCRGTSRATSACQSRVRRQSMGFATSSLRQRLAATNPRRATAAFVAAERLYSIECASASQRERWRVANRPTGSRPSPRISDRADGSIRRFALLEIAGGFRGRRPRCPLPCLRMAAVWRGGWRITRVIERARGGRAPPRGRARRLGATARRRPGRTRRADRQAHARRTGSQHPACS